jgi:hypothetical protein
MARVSNRVKNYVSAKGDVKQMSLMDTYYKTVELRTVLCDIALQHKSWGKEWYNLVEGSLFDKAQFAIITHGKGDMVADAIEKIVELADLEAHMKTLERGDN